jgi:3-isopropylmalate/(R)-2-methylmalate dehydratase small subunit
MALQKITQVTGRGIFVPGDGLGEFAFADARIAEKNAGRIHPLDDPRFNGATILISGSNFGCGSSREHAPQALYRFGHRAVIAESFAEIFFGNSTTLGVPCVKMSQLDITGLASIIESDPAAMITIDLTENKVTVADVDFTAEISMPGHAREALTTGRWDSIADLVDGLDEVRERASSIPYLEV